MTRKQLFICDLLQRREIGYLHRSDRRQLASASLRLADKLLVHNNMIKTIPCIDEGSRSSYMADTNNRGIAAMTHSNRCISLIDTGIMKRIGEINGFRRTVWTLCFHPYDLYLLATGNLGGTVCVFRKTILIRSQSVEDDPITSISFHPKEPLIFYAINFRIIIWNYEDDIKVSELFASEESRIKYVKYNPSNDMLITGIRRENNILNITINDEPDENDETRLISCSSFLDHLMRSLRSIIDSMETRNFVNLDYFWRHILTQTTSFYNMLESCTKVQLQPIKYIGDFNISLALMQRRLLRIISHALNCDNNSTNVIDTTTTDEIMNSMSSTMRAIEFILKLYKKEIEQSFDATDDLQLPLLTDIIVTIEKVIRLDGLSNLIGRHVKSVNEFQYRLQAWNLSELNEVHLPDFAQDWRNLITYCYIHNDSTVEISKCGKLIASFELVNPHKMITIHSLEQSTLGEHIYSYLADMEEMIMSLSFSPSLEYLLVGIRSPELFGYFLKIHKNSDELHLTVRSSQQYGDKGSRQSETDSGENVVMLKRSPVSENVISYLKWSARPGDGIIIGYKTYQLRCLIRNGHDSETPKHF